MATIGMPWNDSSHQGNASKILLTLRGPSHLPASNSSASVDTPRHPAPRICSPGLPGQIAHHLSLLRNLVGRITVFGWQLLGAAAKLRELGFLPTP